jgi:hypothetical protein
MNRRDWLITSAAATGSALTMMRLQQHKYSRDLRPKRSRVAILHTEQYSDKLDEIVYEGLRLFNLNVRGRSVLLKPNIVEYIPGKPVNTDARLIGATAEAFLRLDATSVTVGEGPGHHRDTDLLLYETGLGDQLSRRKITFMDLNRGALIKTKLQANYSGLGHLWLPRTVLSSDFIVSMPKVKNTSLDRRHVQHEKHVRHCPRQPIRLAEKCSSLGWNRRKHSRHLRHGSSELRDRGWHHRNGRRRASQR